MSKEIGEYINEIIMERGTPRTWTEAGLLISEANLRLGLDRHIKYGSMNISKHGKSGIIIRLTDKIERLTTMIHSESKQLKDNIKFLNAKLEEVERILYNSEETDNIKEKIEQVIKKQNDTEENQTRESIEDSFGDTSNYAIYGIMLERSWWNLPCTETSFPPLYRHALNDPNE